MCWVIIIIFIYFYNIVRLTYDLKNRYIKAVALRQVLENLDPIPADDILKRAAELSRHLITTNRMHSPFDSRFDPTVADETGCIPDFNPGTIVEAIMDVDPSPLPLFVRFLRRRSTPQTCMVCSKTLYDVDYENVDAWKSTCKGFEGSWMWNILSFPTREIQQCDHEFGVCRACTAEHLRSTIITGGPSACENLSCPQCRRKLSYEEIHRLADPDTIARYTPWLPSKLTMFTKKIDTRNSFSTHFYPTSLISAGVLAQPATTANYTKLLQMTKRSLAVNVTSKCVSITKCHGTET